VFLDEAGNFDFSTNGTAFFCLSAITASRPFLWEESLSSVKYDLLEHNHNIEFFHASEDKQNVRDKVFAVIGGTLDKFRIDSLVVEKRKTHPNLRSIEKFYPKMIGYLLTYIERQCHFQNYQNIIVLTDSIPVNKKRRAVEKATKITLAQMLPSGTRYQVLHHESRSCAGLQVADYCNWAIFRKWERQDYRSYNIIGAGIKSEFNIFAISGTTYY